MNFPALPDLTSSTDDLASVREKLLAVRASLQQACNDLDAQLEALEELIEADHREKTQPNLFETEPVPPITSLPAPKSWPSQITTSIVMEATSPMALAPELEQATLEELNNALAKAFAQISGQHPWAG